MVTKNILYCVCFLFLSCLSVDCPSLAETYRQEQCIIIAKEFPDKESVYNFEIVGTSLHSGKDTIYNEENRWFCSFYNKMSIGDTIIKRKGQLVFSIHKKDSIYNYDWDCEGKVYK